MATAIEMLKAAAGEISLHTRLGKWAQKVSSLIDLGIASGVLATPDYGFAKRALSTQPGVTTSSPLELNASFSRGITYQNFSWILNPGKTYLLRGVGWFDSFNAPGSSLNVQWVDDNNVALVTDNISCPTGVFRPVTNTSDASSAAGVEFIYKVPANAGVVERSVKLRTTGGSGTANIDTGAWSSTVVEIPGGI